MAPMLLVLLVAQVGSARVRPMDAAAQQLLDRALTHSHTVARLVESLEQRDVVVYIAPALGTSGRLTFVGYGAPLTYVMIRIDLTQREPQRSAILAHELTHALEVAEACPQPRTEADLLALYRRIGLAGVRAGEFETARASANEQRARRETLSAIATPDK
jgi:GH24 family phage-related lysozyme (muramidase)